MPTCTSYRKRFARRAIDTAVTFVPVFFIAFAFGSAFAAATTRVNPQTMDGIGSLLGVLVAWLCFATMESSPLQAALRDSAPGHQGN